jgi:hypothetical protein
MFGQKAIDADRLFLIASKSKRLVGDLLRHITLHPITPSMAQYPHQVTSNKTSLIDKTTITDHQAATRSYYGGKGTRNPSPILVARDA